MDHRETEANCKCIPGDGTARRCQWREGDLKEFVHCLDVFDKVLELSSESVDGVFKNGIEVGLAVSYQIQLLLDGSSHRWLHKVDINLQYIGVPHTMCVNWNNAT